MSDSDSYYQINKENHYPKQVCKEKKILEEL